jgi:peptide deformylase
MTAIVQEPNPILRQIAMSVPVGDIGTDTIHDIISRMKTALASQDDGVAIAAPQIGESVRIFVVARRISKKFAKELEDDLVFINPEIIRLGKKKEEMSEGCLSVRWKYGLVKRSLTATVKAINENGNEFVMSGSGLLAQIFQHEIDHLDGTLFIDKAQHVEEHPPEEDK